MSGFDINQLTITGNLIADPELRNLPSGKAVCKIRIAHNDRRKNSTGEWTDVPGFFDVTIWGGWASRSRQHRQARQGRRRRPPEVARVGSRTAPSARRSTSSPTASSQCPATATATESDEGFEPRADDDIPF